MVYGFGIYEKGKHRAKIGEKHTKEYLVWHSMIARCYNKNYHGSKNYKDVQVCEEWRYFQDFCDWFDENYYSLEDECVVLEKDYKTFAYNLDKNYSKENCIFLPQSFNKFISFPHSVSLDLPVGVKNYECKDRPYSVDASLFDGIDGYPAFHTKEEAYECYLYQTYKRLSKKIEDYKDKIPINCICVLEDFIKNDCLREMHKMQQSNL